MKPQRIAEPDYDFRLETMDGAHLAEHIIFTTEISILKCTRGEALISINGEMHEFATDANFLLGEGMVFKMIDHSEDFEVKGLRFSSHFFNEIYPFLDGKTIEMMSFSAPDLYNEEERWMLDLIFEQLCLLHENREHTFRNKMVKNLTINYVFEIYEQTYKYVKDYAPTAPDNRRFLIDHFFRLCNETHMQHHNVDYYAGQLNITTRYLHKICKDALQTTPKQCIDYMVTGSAKRLLLTTTLNLQQISNEMNFPDQGTFTQFFKRTVGLSPLEFRTRFK